MYVTDIDMDFNPRAPRGARLRIFSIKIKVIKFQSTCPARGTTSSIPLTVPDSNYFNPRAPRGARHNDLQDRLQFHDQFQSTCPARGTTLFVMLDKIYDCLFQSTCPARGTTDFVGLKAAQIIISIHVPREGHDCNYDAHTRSNNLFQSTCPARGTTIYYNI